MSVRCVYVRRVTAGMSEADCHPAYQLHLYLLRHCLVIGHLMSLPMSGTSCLLPCILPTIHYNLTAESTLVWFRWRLCDLEMLSVLTDLPIFFISPVLVLMCNV